MGKVPLPRNSRRSRKPVKENWVKGPPKGRWLRCSYERCSFEWQYFGDRRWAECPTCHSSMKVSVGVKNYRA